MLRRRLLGSLASGGALLLAGCSDGQSGSETTTSGRTTTDTDSFSLTAPAFGDGESIPTRYTADGRDESPALHIDGVPSAAASLALVVDDPDAPDPPFTHWLLWDLEPTVDVIPSDIDETRTVGQLDGATQGRNDFGELGYRGPSPPAGDGPHTYRFTLFALDSPLGLDPGAARAAVDEALAGNVVADVRLTGEYER